jgi:hypothetical protein
VQHVAKRSAPPVWPTRRDALLVLTARAVPSLTVSAVVVGLLECSMLVAHGVWTVMEFPVSVLLVPVEVEVLAAAGAKGGLVVAVACAVGVDVMEVE